MIRQPSNSPQKNRSFFRLQIYLWAAIAGALLGFASVGWPTIRGDINPDSIDRLTHITGANYFIQGDWEWPLFHVSNMREPDGANVIFTDSIPWFAAIFKILQWPVNYFGFWLWFCFVAQAAAAVFAGRAVGLRRKRVLMPLAILACAMPALQFRLGHAALCGHFLLLLTLGHYFWSRRQTNIWRVLGMGTAVSWFALYTHPYLWAMTTPVVALTLLLGAMEDRWPWKRLAEAFALWVVLTFAVLWVGGYIGGGSGVASSGGFGVFSMNVLSPLIPQFSALFAGAQGAYQAADGQYEGMNYLGAAVWLLLVIGTWAARQHLPDLLRRHLLLLLLLAGFTVYAWSNIVYIGPFKVLEYPVGPFDALTRQFRGSGRFFWPVAYFALVAAVWAIGHLRLRTATGLLWFAAGLQWFEIQPLWKADAAIPPNPEQTKQFDRWDSLLSAHDRLALFPEIAYRPEHERIASIHLVWRASRINMPTTTVFLPRGSRTPAEDLALLENYPVSPGTLLVYASEELTPILGNLVPAPDGFTWRRTSLGPALSDRWHLVEGYDWPPIAMPVLDVSEIAFNEAGNSHLAIRSGFSGQEPTGRWTEGSSARLVLPTAGNISNAPHHLRLRLSPFLDEQHPHQHLTVLLNGKNLGRVDFQWPEDHHLHELVLSIPSGLLPSGPGLLEIRLEAGPTKSPRQLGRGDDARSLGFFVEYLQIEPVTPSAEG